MLRQQDLIGVATDIIEVRDVGCYRPARLGVAHVAFHGVCAYMCLCGGGAVRGCE